MKPLALNMSAFRKVAEDKHTSTLENSSGHQIKIAHNSLPREHRNLLRALPMYAADQGDPEQKDLKFANGGNVPKKKLAEALQGKKGRKRYADGTPNEPVSAIDPNDYEDAASYATAATSLDPSKSYGNAIADYAMQTKARDDEKAKQQAMNNPAPGESFADARAKAESPPVDRNVASNDAPLDPPSPRVEPSPVAAPPPSSVPVTANAQPSVDVSQPPTSSDELSPTSGYQQELKAAEQQRQVDTQLGAENKKILDKQLAAQTAVADKFQKNSDIMDRESSALEHEIRSGQISPDKYWDNHSKIATGLGIILAGFNPTNSPNAALEFLKDNIDRDTKAQIAQGEKQNNLLGHYAQHFGNLKDAAVFANKIKADQMSNELLSAAAGTSDLAAKARYNALVGGLKQKFYPEYLGLKLKRAMIDASSQGHDMGPIIKQLQVLDPKQSDELQKYYVNGVGMATNEVPPAVRDKLIAHQTLDHQISDLQNFISQHKGAIFKGDWTSIPQGKEKVLAIQQGIREAMLQTVYREGEKPLLDKIVKADDPTSIFTGYNLGPQIEELKNSNAARFNELKKGYGLPETPVESSRSLSPQQQALLNKARANPNHPNSAKVIKALGGG